MSENKVYLAIDLKSFYASVECRERGLDPLTTNLVVADKSRTEKTICLAVSPSLKIYGLSGRSRLFEVVQKVKEINSERRQKAPFGRFGGKSCNQKELLADPSLELDYIVAPPRMAYYMKYSADIFKIYLKYVAPEDIHSYSIDEVFMDVTNYLQLYRQTPYELAMTIIRDVLNTTGITATAGIGTNLYLCKIAMDIMAKHIEPDKDGVRIARLDEMSYRRMLWDHRPLTDFWRIGHGYAKKLEQYGMYTMGDVAACSVGKPGDFYNAELLYRLFGVNAELLIDHAWGWEPCTIADIKAYKPQTNSISSGQVLHRPYEFREARLVAKEMIDLLSLELVEKELLTDQLVLTIGYDVTNLSSAASGQFSGEITTDHYGRRVPKAAHGTANLGCYTSSTRQMIHAAMELFDRIVDQSLFVRRITVVAGRVIDKSTAEHRPRFEQINMFSDYEAEQKKKEKELAKEQSEQKLQLAMLGIKKKYGKNAILKGMNFRENATAKDRNAQIGGHKA